VLQRAAFGPREAAPKRSQNTRTTKPVDPRANVVVKAASWLRDNL
jgi:hypothetical protein